MATVDSQQCIPVMKSEEIVHIPQDVGAHRQQVALVESLDRAFLQRGTKRSRREQGASGKERLSKIPVEGATAGKRSSIFRGVTRHRWTGRYEAHLWDKSTWNATQKKKGKQVYLGAYDVEEAAARAYDLAALKYWGPTTLINFPVSDYTKDLEEMRSVSREEYLASLRRKSSGFSRGVSKYRGVARHHHNGRWEARIGRVFGNKYLYLGTYSTQEEAAAAYDMAAIEYRGLNAVTNFDLSRYIRWLRPEQMTGSHVQNETKLVGEEAKAQILFEKHCGEENARSTPRDETPIGYQLPSLGYAPGTSACQKSSSPTALSLLLQSSMFKQMLEKASVGNEAIQNEYNSGIDLRCTGFLSGQQLADELQTEIATQESKPCFTAAVTSIDSLYEARDPSEDVSNSGSSHGALQFGGANDEDSPVLDEGLCLWSEFGSTLNALENFLA